MEYATENVFLEIWQMGADATKMRNRKAKFVHILKDVTKCDADCAVPIVLCLRVGIGLMLILKSASLTRM